jgi:hypothetical protein
MKGTSVSQQPLQAFKITREISSVMILEENQMMVQSQFNCDWRVLTGNPYPSAIDLSAFLLDATNTTGIAYFLGTGQNDSHYIADYKGGYGTFSPLGGSGTAYIPSNIFSYDGSGNEPVVMGTEDYARRFLLLDRVL